MACELPIMMVTIMKIVPTVLWKAPVLGWHELQSSGVLGQHKSSGASLTWKPSDSRAVGQECEVPSSPPKKGLPQSLSFYSNRHEFFSKVEPRGF